MINPANMLCLPLTVFKGIETSLFDSHVCKIFNYILWFNVERHRLSRNSMSLKWWWQLFCTKIFSTDEGSVLGALVIFRATRGWVSDCWYCYVSGLDVSKILRWTYLLGSWVFRLWMDNALVLDVSSLWGLLFCLNTPLLRECVRSSNKQAGAQFLQWASFEVDCITCRSTKVALKSLCENIAAINIFGQLVPCGLVLSDGCRPGGLTLSPYSRGECLVWDGRYVRVYSGHLEYCVFFLRSR